MREGRFRSGPLLALLLLTLVPAALSAAPFGLTDEEAAVRIAELEGYDVLMLSDSYVLRPIGEDRDFEILELRAEGLVIDGRKLGRAELARRLGEDLERILALRQPPPEAPSEAEAAGAPESPEAPEPPAVEASEAPKSPERERRRSGARVSFGSDRYIEAEESVEEVVVIGGRLTSKGEVRGSAVAIGGPVRIEGKVGENVISVGGSVSLGPGAVVQGDVVSVMGRVERHRDAVVRGEVSEVSFGSGADFRPGESWRLPDLDRALAWGRPFWKLFLSICLALVVCFVVLVAGDLVREVSQRVELEPWKALLVGLVSQILFFPLVAIMGVFLLVSVIGIPLLMLLLPTLFLAVLAVELLGYTAVARSLGGWTRRRFDWPAMGPYALVLVGLAMLQSWTILGEILSLTWGPIKLSGLLLIFGGFLIKYIGWSLGLGGVLLRFFAPGASTPGGPRTRLPAAKPASPPGSDPDTGEFSDVDTDTLETESTDPWFGSEDEEGEPDEPGDTDDMDDTGSRLRRGDDG